MPSSESEAHGRTHRSVEISIDAAEIARVTAAKRQDDEDELVRMSDGNVIPREDVLAYADSFTDTDIDERRRKTDTIVISGVAGLSAAALALALHRLRKRHQE